MNCFVPLRWHVVPFSTPNYNELVTELHNAIDRGLNPASESDLEISISDELAEIYKKSKTISSWFRKHYNLLPNDERFLNMSMAEIYEDYIEIKFGEFSELFEEDTPAQKLLTQEELEQIVEDEVKAIKMNKDNYADEDYIQKCREEEEEMLKAYDEGVNYGRKEVTRINEILNRRKTQELIETFKVEKPNG